MKNEKLDKKFKTEVEAECGFKIDFRKDGYLRNTIGATPSIPYARCEKIIRAAYAIAFKKGYMPLWNFNIEMDKARTSIIKMFLLQLNFNIEQYGFKD